VIADGSFGKQYKSFPTTVNTEELLSGPKAHSLVRALRKEDAAGFMSYIANGKIGLNESLDSQKMTPLHLAAVARSATILRFLLKNQAVDFNPGNRDGDTPLMLLIKASTSDSSSFDLASLFVRNPKLIVEKTNGDGATALSIAAAKGFKSITSLLVEEGRIDKYSFKSLAVTLKLALMFEQEHLVETIFRSMGSGTGKRFLAYLAKEGPEFEGLGNLLYDLGFFQEKELATATSHLTVSQENLKLFALRCTMPGTPEFFQQKGTKDAKGHLLLVGNLVRILSEEVVRKLNPRIDGEDDDFIEAVADQQAYIHEIDDDGDLYLDTTDTPYSGYINAKSVTYVNDGPRQEIQDGTKIGVGYLVKVIEDEEEVKSLAKGHGGWKPEWKECCGRTGRVCKVDKAGDIFVYFSWGPRVCLNPMALLVSSSGKKGGPLILLEVQYNSQ
jgi:hypothetical protein